MGQIVSFTGLSGAGKTTVVRELLKEPQYVLVPSITTRGPRLSDLPGEYEYVPDPEFDWLKCWNAFLWDVSFIGNRYGTKSESIETALKAPQCSVMILVPSAVQTLRGFLSGINAIASVTSFYIRSPEEKVLRSRMEQRGELLENIERRLKESKSWDEQAERSGIPYVFINNNGTIDEAVEQVKEYLK